MLLLPDYYGYITMSISLFNLVVKTCIFITLVSLMRNYAREQYKINAIPMTIYFILDFLAYFIAIYLYTHQRLSNGVHDDDQDAKVPWDEFLALIMYLLNIP